MIGTPPKYLFGWQQNYAQTESGNWQVGEPTLNVSKVTYSGLGSDGEPDNCVETGPYIFTDSAGRSHDLGLVHVAPQDQYGAGLCPDPEADTAVAADDDGLRSVMVWNQSVTVAALDGTRYVFNGTEGYSVPLEQVEDRNGNRETIAVSGSTETWTDSSGRAAAVIVRGANGEPATVTLRDSGGNASTYSLTWSTAGFSYTLNDPNLNSCPYPDDCEVAQAAIGSVPALTALELPDGTSYGFSYDPNHGTVSEITLPAGGNVQFTYGVTPLDEDLDYGDANGAEQLPYDDLAVTKETRSDGGVWSYAYASTTSNGAWESKTTTITDPSGNTTALTYEPYALVGSVGGGSNLSLRALEVQRVVKSAAGATLRVVTTNYSGLKPRQVQTAMADCVCSSPPTAEVDYTWGQGSDILEEDDYDYLSCRLQAPPATPASALACAAGALLKKTVRAYMSDGQWILDRPTSVVVYNGAATRVAETDYGYDSYPAGLALSGTVQHDATYVGSGFTARGNATSMTRWVAGGAGLTTTYTYDDAGNRLSATDAAGDATSYSYADNWANGACAPAGGNAASYLTRVTDALGHATSMSYNSCSGTLAARTDANDQTWTWSYDSEGRETGATRPDGGVTTIAYTATTIETRRKINASTWQDHVETLDSLGREADEATETAAGNWMHLTTCRDPATGEPAYASYPFASSTPAGGGTCLDPRDTFTYDALGRPLSVTHSDGTVFNTTYAGRATETQDEGNGNGSARVTRIGQVNALGQLVAVCEVTASAPPAQGPAPAACGLDIAATGYLTDYTPDALGNVLAVVQGVEARAFFYDGLSRLTSASNPESGATSYVYGADGSCAAPDDFPGDLAGRLDARGVLTCYRYDELRRLTGKSYSDGTPAVTYGYDQTTALGVNGLANTAGRMSSEQTAADTAAVFSYDSTGRTAATWQFTPQTWGSSSYNFGDGYDLAGDRLTSVYSRGATLTTAYDLAGRPLSLASSTQGTLISGVTYNARAQETGGTLGNALPMTRGYDQRGRLTSVLVGTASYYVPATPATGWIEVDGDEQSYYRPPLVWDHGSVHVAVNGTDTATVSYGESSDSATLQDSLASDLNGSLVRVDSGGNITTAATGSGANYALTDWSESADPGDFDPPSFEVYTSGPTLTGGADAHWVSGTTDYQLSGVSYAGDGDLLGATDSANGGSIYTYNDLNQLTEACDGGCYGYSYDRYANRWAAATPTSVGATFNNSANRVDGASYDATGNLLAANGCGFTFDAESRLTTVSGCATASYVYDAEGRRVRETVNGVVKEFVYGEGPQGLTVMDGSENLVRQETDFGGQYLGTAAPSGFTWAHTDELGTVRARTNTAGSLAETYTSFPYGEDLNQVGVISNEHFTGKYRDGETSLDNFGARYYASSYGRYLTPDWSASPEPIPYANLGNPQSLNLYSYVLDNPVTETDADGHICCFDWLKKFGGSLYNSTLGAAWNMASHPLATAEGIGFMARHPLIAARGAEQATVTVTQQIGQGNPVAIGTGVGVVGMALIPGGEAGDAAEGAEAAEAATGAVLPAEESQLGHIFREAEGHLPDTPENRALLENVANDPANSLGTAANGTSWSARTLPDGQQVWVQTRGGRIVNGGIINDTPRTSNPSTGLSGGGGL